MKRAAEQEPAGQLRAWRESSCMEEAFVLKQYPHACCRFAQKHVRCCEYGEFHSSWGENVEPCPMDFCFTCQSSASSSLTIETQSMNALDSNFKFLSELMISHGSDRVPQHAVEHEHVQRLPYMFSSELKSIARWYPLKRKDVCSRNVATSNRSYKHL